MTPPVSGASGLGSSIVVRRVTVGLIAAKSHFPKQLTGESSGFGDRAQATSTG